MQENNPSWLFLGKISDHNCYRMLKLHGMETSFHICLDGKHLKYCPQNTSFGCTLQYISRVKICVFHVVKFLLHSWISAKFPAILVYLQEVLKFPGNRLWQFEKGLASFGVVHQPMTVPLAIASVLTWKKNLWLIIAHITMLNCLFQADNLWTFHYFILLISFLFTCK